MTDEDIVLGPEDIERDLEGTRKAEARLAAFFGRRAVRTRGGSRPPSESLQTPLGIGRQLVARCPADTQRSYRTLLTFENAMPADGDYGILIGAACNILEAELRRLLATSAQPIADLLIAALNAAKKQSLAAMLDKWKSGSPPTTFGTLSLLLLALRKGCEQGIPEIARFLADRFQPRFVDLLMTGKVASTLESIRVRFRNPANHAERVFDAADYAAFSRLVIANQRFAAWDTAGPDPSDPDPSTGVLYHHLQHALETTRTNRR